MFSPSAFSLIVYQVLAHVAFFYGLVIGSIYDWVSAITLYFILATLGGTITYHRLVSHKSFSAPTWFTYLGCALGSLGGNGSPLAWAAVHREHHRFTDTERDPHSPWQKGFFRVQFGSMLERPNLRYIPDLLRSKFHLQLHKWYWLWNIIYASIVSFIFGSSGLIFGYFIPTLLVWHAGSLINTLNHTLGYVSHKTKDKSTNNFLTGILVSGEGWHNNHHANPASPKFGEKWYEFDLGYQIIKLVKK